MKAQTVQNHLILFYFSTYARDLYIFSENRDTNDKNVETINYPLKLMCCKGN